jgi:dolichol-phosphate mannosyltransferase
MADGGRRLISIVVPVFNEEQNVRAAYDAVRATMAKVADRYDFEMIFTDNHSTDRTFEILSELAALDRRVRVIRFSRNFGFQRSIFTGYMNARGAAAVQLDCDLQDPPELVLDFLAKWEGGYQVVYGVRRQRREAWWMQRVRKAFYRLIDFLSEDRLPHDAGDFRLVDRRVLDELARMEDSRPYLRGAIATLGFNQVGIAYDRAERLHGSSKFSWGQLVSLALDGILNHSVVPLRVATYTGVGVAVLTTLGIGGYVAGRVLFRQDWPAGFATTTVLLLLGISLNALFLGIIGEYLGRIYVQVKRRPITVVERRIGPVRNSPIRSRKVRMPRSAVAGLTGGVSAGS